MWWGRKAWNWLEEARGPPAYLCFIICQYSKNSPLYLKIYTTSLPASFDPLSPVKFDNKYPMLSVIGMSPKNEQSKFIE